MAGDESPEVPSPELRAVLDADLQGWAVARSVREHGTIIDFQLIYINGTGARLVGGRPDELLGRRYRELWPETVHDGTLPHYRDVVERRTPMTRTVYYDRESISGHFDLHVSPFRDGFIARFVDLSELVLGRASPSGTRLYDLLDAAFDGFCLLRAVRDHDQRIVDFTVAYVNQLGAKLAGRTVEDLVERPLTRVAPASARLGLIEQFARVVETGEPLLDQVRLPASSQTWEIKAIRPDGYSVAISYRDITAQLGHEAAIARSAMQARASAARARESAERIAALQTITATLVAARTPAGVYAAMSNVVRPSAGGRGLVVLARDGHKLVLDYHAGYEPDVVEQLRELPLTHQYPATSVALTGRPKYLTCQADFLAAQPDPTSMISGGGRQSWAFLPLTTAGNILGVLVIGYARTREFDPAERANLMTYAGLCAQALQRTRLFEAQASIAAALQRALLPTRLAPLTGARHATRYLPWTEGTDVGGDWYDLIPLGEDSVAAVIGDVAGHSTSAAATMGQLRSAIRAFAADGHSPTGVIHRASQLLMEFEPDTIATCCYLELHLAEGTATAVLAGHPPPVLCAEGEARPLTLRTGPPLGAHPEPRYQDTSFLLPGGASLLLYTDGLVEDRRFSIDRGLAELCATVRRAPVGDPAALIEHTLDSGVGPSPRSDDVAILAVTIDPGSSTGPRTATRRFRGEAANVPAARRFAGDILIAWGQVGLLDDACLILDELFTNAVQHTVGAVTVRLTLDEQLRVEVFDCSNRQPTMQPVGPHSEAGRGLHIIDRLSARWGVASAPAGGKTVWFELAALHESAPGRVRSDT